MKICRRFFTFLAFFGLNALPVETSAQLTKLTTSYVSDSAGVLPLWLAKETGIFARNGLDVQAVRVHAAVGVMALMSGELQFVLASGPVVLDSALRGSNAVYVAGGMSTLDFVLVTRPEIKTAEQLKGGTVGLSAFRGANPTATRFALQKLGLGPKDVSLIVVGGTSERIASLRLGKIQGTLFSPPQNITAQREGFNALADVAELGLPFVHIGLATTRTFIRDNPEIVRRYVKSHIEAIAAMKTDREMAIKTLEISGANQGPRRPDKILRSRRARQSNLSQTVSLLGRPADGPRFVGGRKSQSQERQTRRLRRQSFHQRTR